MTAAEVLIAPGVPPSPGAVVVDNSIYENELAAIDRDIDAATAEEAKAAEESRSATREAPKPEEPKPAAADKAALARAALAKRAARIEKAETALREERESSQGQVAQLRALQEQLRVEREGLSKQGNAVREIHAALAGDPIAYLEKFHDISLQDLGRRMLNRGKASPEELARRSGKQATGVAQELAQLRGEMAAEKERAEHTTAKTREESAFVASVTATTYPTISKLYSPAELVEEGYRVVAEAKRLGIKPPSDADILDYLEYRASTRAARVAGTPARARPAKPAPAARTKPKDLLSLDPEERRREFLRVIDQARRAGATVA